MGVPGLWNVLGPAGERQALLYAAQCDDRLKVAVDVSIWLFQCQAAQGGENAELRTFFYRLCRLSICGIQALFVFDGPAKPPIKRGKASRHSAKHGLLKKMLKLFGFPSWEAPGEAEAECAYLQRQRIVDAVLSDDVDAFLFGATCVYKQWAATSADHRKNSEDMAYTLCFTSDNVRKVTGMTREKMILVAVLAGGDYDPGGLPGCGIKLATEIAHAGFAHQLIADEVDLDEWRTKLQTALKTNSEGAFSRRHPKLAIPPDFPSLQTLQYYTKPVVTASKEIMVRAADIDWNAEIDLHALRAFTENHLGWAGLEGDLKFVKIMMGPQLISVLHNHKIHRDIQDKCMTTATDIIHDEHLAIHGSRQHPTAGGLAELRISFVPHVVVPIALSSDVQETPDTTEVKPAKFSVSCITSRSRIWILQKVCEKAIPAQVQAWIDKHSEPGLKVPKAPRGQTTLDGFVQCRKDIFTCSSTTAKRKLKGLHSDTVVITNTTSATPEEASASSCTLQGPDLQGPRMQITLHDSPPAKAGSEESASSGTLQVPEMQASRVHVILDDSPPARATSKAAMSRSQLSNPVNGRRADDRLSDGNEAESFYSTRNIFSPRDSAAKVVRLQGQVELETRKAANSVMLSVASSSPGKGAKATRKNPVPLDDVYSAIATPERNKVCIDLTNT